MKDQTSNGVPEIIVKHNYGYSTVFGHESQHYGVAIFANNAGYAYLSTFFHSLSTKLIRDGEYYPGDPGDHQHLTPKSCFADEIDFTFDLITDANRADVLRNARLDAEPLQGPAILQLARVIEDAANCSLGEASRRELVEQLDLAITQLTKKRDEIRAALR